MDNPQVSPEDLQLRRWLFRLKYSLLLRRHLRLHRDGKQRTTNSFAVTTSSFPSLSLQVIVSLTTLAYVCSHYQIPLLMHMGDESITTNATFFMNPLLQYPLKVGLIKALLRQRGVSSESVLERTDIELLAARSGDATEGELSSALAFDSDLSNFNSTCDRDTLLYDSLSSLSFSLNCTPFPGQMKKVEARSVVFDSTSLFVERIEDNRESLWILAAINKNRPSLMEPSPSTATAINPAIWGHLVNRFAVFNIHFGILLCDSLDSICKGHGFSSSNLIMALPNSIRHRKHSVDFQRFPLPQQQMSACNEHSQAGRRVCHRQLDYIAGWIQNALSKRIAPLSDPEELRLGSREAQWYWRRPQPLHLIWIPGQRFQNHTYPLTAHSTPPLSLSALSITYLDRVKFWRVEVPSQSPDLVNSTTQIFPASTPVHKLLLGIGCRSVRVSGNLAHLILLTPEGICRLISTPFIYPKLNQQLRWSFPSINDVFITGLVCLNTVLLLVEILHLSLPHMSLAKLVISRKKHKSSVIMSSQLRMRINIIVGVVRKTFGGWESYIPTPTSQVPLHEANGQIWDRLRSLVQPVLNVLASIALELLFWNLVFLVAALPIVNLMHYALPCVNGLLYLLRLSNVVLSFSNLTGIIILTIVTVFIINECKLFIHSIYKRRHAAVKDNNIPPAPLGIQKLFKANAMSTALTSPNSLAHYLFLSDTEYSNESATPSAGFSDTEFSSSSEASTILPLPASVRESTVLEVARLLKKAMELERIVRRMGKQTDENRILSQFIPSNVVPAKLFVWNLTRTKQENQKSRKVKTFTRRVEKEEENIDQWYDGEDEEETNEKASSHQVNRCRRRQRVKRSSSHFHTPSYITPTSLHPYDWPAWVIPCDYCVVCWRDFKSGSRMAALSCGHGFHSDCLKQWLDTPGRTDCPVCRWPANLPNAQRDSQLIDRLVQTLIGWREHNKMEPSILSLKRCTETSQSGPSQKSTDGSPLKRRLTHFQTPSPQKETLEHEQEDIDLCLEEEEEELDLGDDDDEHEDDDEEEENSSSLVLEDFTDDGSVAGVVQSATPLTSGSTLADSSSMTSAEREEANHAEDRKLLALMAHFNNDQLSRFESFRRATFTKSCIGRLIQSVASCSYSPNVIITMAGITKVYVGELVEAALDYKERLKETGPLQPKHIRAAFVRMQEEQRTSRQDRSNPLF